MELYFGIILAWGYLSFAFVAEQLNPVHKPRNHIRRSQWRYGRKVGLAGLAGGLLFLVLHGVVALAMAVAAIISASLFTVLWFWLSRSYKANTVM